MRWLPNLLTVIRILLTPFIIRDILDGHCTVALPFALVAGASDALDGYLARWLDAESRLGAWLDPLADKALLTGMYFSFGISGLTPMWLAWLVFARDVLILTLVGAGLVLTSLRDFPPSIWGKISTVIQIGVSLVILSGCNGIDLGTRLTPVGVAFVAGAAVWSGLHYLVRAFLVLRYTRQKV